MEAEIRQSFGVPDDMPMRDLGTVKLRNRTPKRIHVRSGNYCTFRAKALTNGLVQLDWFYEPVIKGTNATKVEGDQWVFRPATVEGWRLCFTPENDYLAVAIQPVIIE